MGSLTVIIYTIRDKGGRYGVGLCVEVSWERLYNNCYDTIGERGGGRYGIGLCLEVIVKVS